MNETHTAKVRELMVKQFTPLYFGKGLSMTEQHWGELFDIYRDEFLRRKESTVLFDKTKGYIAAFNLNIDLNDFPPPNPETTSKEVMNLVYCLG